MVDELNCGEDGSGGGGDGGFGVLTARQLWIQPSATGFYESNISNRSEGSGTKCYDSGRIDSNAGVYARRASLAAPCRQQEGLGKKRNRNLV